MEMELYQHELQKFPRRHAELRKTIQLVFMDSNTGKRGALWQDGVKSLISQRCLAFVDGL